MRSVKRRKLFEHVEATTGSLMRVDVAKRLKIMGALVLRSVKVGVLMRLRVSVSTEGRVGKAG